MVVVVVVLLDESSLSAESCQENKSLGHGVTEKRLPKM